MKDSSFGDLLIVLSGIAVILAIIGAFFKDIWLAPTQWLLIAAVLSLYAIYSRVRP